MRAILTYHSVDPSGSVLSIDESTLRRHARWLASGSVRVTSVEGLLALDPAEEAVALTFDDAFRNFATAAWPILREHGLPVTLFVATEHAGRTNTWGGRSEPGVPELPLLGWDELIALADEGVALGSHTRRHPRLPGLPADRLADEVAGSADTIEARTGRRPRGFAYPYGAVDAASATAVAEAYSWACTTRLEPVGAEPELHRLPRLDAYYFRAEGRLEAWGTPAFRAWMGLRRMARSARHLAGVVGGNV